MQFQVPQFLEVEDKLFGSFTLKQFLYVFGGLGISYVFYTYLPIYVAIFLIMIALPFSVALAFVRVNKQPFINIVGAAISYYLSPQLYIWRKVPKTPKKGVASEKAPTASIYVPPLSESRLKDLSWSLDIKNSLNEDSQNKTPSVHKAPLLKDI